MVCVMSERAHFTADEARAVGERIGIDWAISRFDVEQFRIVMDVELEHGTHDPETNVTDDDVSVTAKIARAVDGLGAGRLPTGSRECLLGAGREDAEADRDDDPRWRMAALEVTARVRLR